MSIREDFLTSQRELQLGNTMPPTAMMNTSYFKNMNSDLQNLVRQSETYRQLGKIPEMISLLDQGIAQNPKCKELYHSRGYGYWKTGNDEAAIQSYQKALEIDPNFSLPLNNMGLIFMKRNNFEAAQKYFQQATLGKPENEDAWFNYVTTLSKSGKKLQAIEVLTTISQKFPNNQQAHLWKGHLLKDSGQSQQADNCYNSVLRLNPQNRDALLSLAVMNCDLQQKQQSMEYYRRLIEIYPKDAEVWKMYGDTLRRFGDPRRSVDAFKSALLLHPTCIQTMLEQANNYLDIGETENAMKMYDRILQINPDHAPSLVLKASILANSQPVQNGENKNLLLAQKNAALELLNRAIMVDGNYTDAHLVAGLIQKSIGDTEASLRSLNKVIDGQQFYPIAHISRAGINYVRQDINSAKRDMGALRDASVNHKNLMSMDNRGPQYHAFQKMLEHFIESENTIQNLANNKSDLNTYNLIQARNMQKSIFLSAYTFSDKKDSDYTILTNTFDSMKITNDNNMIISRQVFQNKMGMRPEDHYSIAFYGFSEIIFEHFRSLYLGVESEANPDLNQPLSFIDLLIYGQIVLQKLNHVNGQQINETVFENMNFPIYNCFRDHNAILNVKEEIRRYLSFFSKRKPENNDDFLMSNIKTILAIIRSSKDHINRIEKAASNPDVRNMAEQNILSKIVDRHHREFFADMTTPAHLLGLNDALILRSLMIFYIHKSELQYTTSVHDDIARFLYDRKLLFSRSFPFDKTGGPIVLAQSGNGVHPHSLERPIMNIGVDPDRIINYFEITKIKFIIHKNYTAFTNNEMIVTFKDFNFKPVVYRETNNTDMSLSGYIFPQRRRTVIEMDIRINKDHKRQAILSFGNLVEDSVWVVTEVFKDKPSIPPAVPKNLVKLYLEKRDGPAK